MGEYDQAFKHLKNAKSISDAMKWDNKDKSCHLFDMKFTEILGYIKMQDLENAYLGINNLKNYKSRYTYPSYRRLYTLYFLIGDLDKGYEWYNKYLLEQQLMNDFTSFDIIINPWCKSAHNDNRFIDILKERKLYDYWKDRL